MTPIATLHLVPALLALCLGITVLSLRKGTGLHKALGRSWVVLMLIVAISSFWLRAIEDGGFSLIHGLSVFTLVCLAIGVWAIRADRVKTHRGFMIGTFVGLIGAGAGTLVPGRLIGDLFWGLF